MDNELTRRQLLGGGSGLLLAAGTLSSREALAADGEPPPPPLEFAMKVTADITDAIPLGASPAGDRRIIPITGGKFEGPKLQGIILPGGEDAQFDRSDGVTVFEARYWLKASDGAVIKVVNRAVRGKGYLRTQPVFEAPVGPHDWLNGAIFVGTLSPGAAKQVVLRYYRVA
ncbi:MAG: DUF3237 family protein [Steroidobacteraceae bacterium]